jgi:hypothetical protein
MQDVTEVEGNAAAIITATHDLTLEAVEPQQFDNIPDLLRITVPSGAR